MRPRSTPAARTSVANGGARGKPIAERPAASRPTYDGRTGSVPNIRFLYLYFPTCNERVQMNTKVSRAARHLFPASAAAGGVVAAAGSGRGKLS